MSSKRHSRTSILPLALLAGLTLHSSARALVTPLPPVQDAVPVGRLVIVTTPGVEAAGPAGAAHDFGTIDPINSTRLEQTFHLRNDGSTPIQINYIQPSCGCASAVLAAEGGGDANTVAPGGQIAVRVTLDVSHLHSGHIDKYAMVYIKGKVTPAFTLEMRGELPPLIAYNPRVINFGRIDSGIGGTQTLTITLDRRVLSSGQSPLLICTNPDVEVKLQPEAVPAGDAKQGAQTVIRNYTVTLSRQARMGVVSGAIAFVPAGTKAAKPIQTPYGQSAMIADAIGGASVLLSGDILGKFFGTPYLVVFGSVPQGVEATRQVALTGRTPDILTGMTVSCSLPTMSARLAPAQPSAQANAAGPPRPTLMLEVKLSGQTPPGGLNAEVIVKAKDGERLVIPILGDVIKTNAH